MCIAIYQAPGYRLTEQELANSWNNNPDGAGISFFDSSCEIVIEKTMNRSEFVDLYNKAVKQHGRHSEMAVHFRIATHGGVNITNCHPFHTPDKSMSVIHNGIIPVLFDSKKDPRSDTRVFVEEIIPMLPANWIDNEQLFNMVEEYIGNSKLVVLSHTSESSAYIVNEDMGHWSDDKKIWFSNKSYCSIPKGIVTYKGSAWQSPQLIEEQALPKCMLCDENGVFDDVCYECETCQLCGYIAWTDECCVGMNGKIHSSTQAEWEKIQEFSMWGME
jgi:hypothetical protein